MAPLQFINHINVPSWTKMRDYHLTKNVRDCIGTEIYKPFRLRMKFGEIFWGDIKIDVLKGGGGYKQKGHDYTIFPLSNS